MADRSELDEINDIWACDVLSPKLAHDYQDKAQHGDGDAILPVIIGSDRALSRDGLGPSISDPEQPHTYGVSYFCSPGRTVDDRDKPDLMVPSSPRHSQIALRRHQGPQRHPRRAGWPAAGGSHELRPS